MSNRGFLVKFINDKNEIEDHLCYKVSFDYDAWTYTLNNEETKHFPPLAKIEVIPQEK